MCAAAQSGAQALKALVDSNRVSFNYVINSAGKTAVNAEGTALIDGDCYHITGNGLDIWCDGTTKWTVDSEAKEVYVEGADSREFLANPALFLDKVEGLKVSDKNVSGIYKDPSQSVQFSFKLSSIAKKPLSGSPQGFSFVTGALGSDWVVTDLR